MLYKLLYLDEHREKALSGAVVADDGEKWESLVQALNDLAEDGFEVQCAVYGAAPKSGGGGPIVEAFLLASKSAPIRSDLQRRIARTKALIIAAEDHLATLDPEMSRSLQTIRVRELRTELEELERREQSNSTGSRS